MINDDEGEILEEAAGDIQRMIDMSLKSGVSRHFVSGLETAKGIITGEIQVLKDRTLPQEPTLF